MSATQKKANYVLHIICIAFVFIALRVAHLGIIQREDKLKEAEKPRMRALWMRADRGEICDRFHIPLATSRICYHAAIYYAQIQQIPARSSHICENGQKIRTSPRKEHIQALSQMLHRELGLEATKVEDLIYAKASLLPHVPLIVKEDITEEEYYRIKMLEKDYPGLSAEIGSKRHYPQGKVACHIIGTMGSISSKEYTAIAEEIRSLQTILSEYEAFQHLPPEYESIEEVHARMDVLKDKAYTFNDKVGKSGIERQFEEDLRGVVGRKIIEVDNQGKPTKELAPCKPPQEGHRIVLTISAELQKFAEELLIEHERERDHKSFGIDPKDKKRKEQKQPWIKGGAIVALDPKTGEVIALASHPRFDPNDFVSHQNLSLWLENEKMKGSLWDGRSLLTRESWKKSLFEEKVPVSWEFYLESVLPKEGGLKSFFEKVDDIKSFVQVQEDFQTLLFFSRGESPETLMEAITSKTGPIWEALRASEDALPSLWRLCQALQPIASPKDRLFALDLCRLCIDSPRFSDELLAKMGAMKMGTYRLLTQAFCRFASQKKEEAFQTFHKTVFPAWREENQKKFLAEKRREEREKKTYAKPYIDYLALKEKELFHEFWEENKIAILLESIHEAADDPDRSALQKTLVDLSSPLSEEWLRTFRMFHELDRPLLSQKGSIKTEKQLAAAFYPSQGFGYGRSYAFQATSPQGSLFKLVTAYEGLRQGHNISIIDELGRNPLAPPGQQLIVAYTLGKTPFPRLYRGGRLPKSSSMHIGKIDVVGAIEHSSNPYFSILAGDYLKHPEDLNRAASLFGFGSFTGIDLPSEATGSLPTDLTTNRTGLYSYAFGQHTLLNTPLQSAVMLAALANGGNILKPQIVKEIRTPASTWAPSPLIKNSLLLPPSIRNLLMEGMDRCVWSGGGGARASSIRTLLSNPAAMHEYLLLEHQMIGKTSTAEIVFNADKTPSSSPQVYKHVWFGSIGFPIKSKWDHPELVVVVFLRFGSSGKDAAPLAAQMIHKWREIQEKHRM